MPLSVSRAQILTGLFSGIIGIFVVYYSPQTYADCLRQVVKCPSHTRFYLEVLGYGIMFVAAALIGAGLNSWRASKG